LAIAAAPVVAPHPFIVHLGQPATVSVTGISVASLEVRLAGATTAKGVLLPWRAMVRAGGGEWQAVLPRPALRGVYEIQLRAGPTSPVLSSQNWLLRVLDPGTLEHPAFATPEAVARWWVRTVPAQMRLVALRRWTRPASTVAIRGCTNLWSSPTGRRVTNASAIGSACSSWLSGTGMAAAGVYSKQP